MLDGFPLIEDKMEYGKACGQALGLCAGVVATTWGGYELGTAINDFLSVEGTLSRGAIDSLTMAIAAGPAIWGSYTAGGVAGIILGAVSHPFIETAYKGYNYFKRD